MINLLKTDLKRAIKDKLFIVLCIIAGAFSLMTPFLYKLLFVLMEFDADLMKELEMLNIGINAKSMFFGAFSLSNNFGLILPIFVAIILSKDFSHGTIRNKIICGKSRASIYFSMLITCIILIVGFILAHAVITLLVSLTMFSYQNAPFTSSDFGYLMASIGLEIIVYFLVCAILTFFIVSMKNAGLSIVMYFVVSFALIIVGSILMTTIMFASPTMPGYEVLSFISNVNVYTSTFIGGGASYELNDVLAFALPNILLSIGFVFLGLLSFSKKDIK